MCPSSASARIRSRPITLLTLVGVLVVTAASTAQQARAQSCAADNIYGAAIVTPPGAQQRNVSVADLNGDGVPDLVISSDVLEVRLGAIAGGTPSYGPPQRYSIGGTPAGSAIADFDADGIPDLVVACLGGLLIQFRGLGDGTFAKVQTFSLVPDARDVVATDVNGDGIVDLAITGPRDRVVLMQGFGDGLFRFPYDFLSLGFLKGFVVADLDGDGAPDVAAATDDQFIVVHAGTMSSFGPTGQFGLPITLPIAHGATFDVTAADFNGDGRLDLASADSSGTVTVYLQTAPMTFATLVTHVVPGATYGIRAADVNHDGYPDLVASAANGGASFALLMNEGPNSGHVDHLGDAIAFGPERSGSGIMLADLDRDGTLDVLTPSTDFEPLALFLNRCPLDHITFQVTITGGGSVARVPEQDAYRLGDTVTLTATPAPTYLFQGWSGDATGSGNSITVVLDRARFVVAAFPPILHDLHVSVRGSGLVARTPAGSVLHEGTTVHLTAEPALGYLFVAWSGDTTATADTLDIVMRTDRSVTATFRADPAVVPVIASITDVPSDQGGFVTLRWRPSVFEFVPQDSGVAVSNYFIWRAVPPAALETPIGVARMRTALAGREYVWEYLATVPATGSDLYRYVAATTPGPPPPGNPYTTFMVEGRDVSGTQFWDSPPDSGYSIDDLAPEPPGQFLATLAAGSGTLQWSASPDPDLLEYRIHRGADPAFVPAPGNLIGTTSDTTFMDQDPVDSYYKLAAVDVHGNVGAYALTALLGQAFALDGTAPNPSVGGNCVVRLVLPSAATARLELIDITGRIVAARELRQAGRQSVNLAAGRRIRAGLYWVRLVQGANVRSARAVVLD